MKIVHNLRILISDEILFLFRFAQPIVTKAKERMNKVLTARNLTNKNSVVIGIHNRRGDMARGENGYVSAPIEYFEAAMTYSVYSSLIPALKHYN